MRLRGALVLTIPLIAHAHDPITTKLTWNREISRIVYSRCAVCHRPQGVAFSLLTYAEARPWAKAIEEEVFERRMPPWGAVKGFGEFRNEQALNQEQLELIAQWVEGGAPEGESKDLPPLPAPPKRSPVAPAGREIPIEGDFTIDRAAIVNGIRPKVIAREASLQIVAALPDGSLEPLVWLHHYDSKYSHAFLLRTPLHLPKGTVILGVPPGSRIALLTATPARAPAHRNAPYSPRPSAGTAPKPGKFLP